jgi:dihydrofolate synthase/folylpolyglutamate synthase
VFEQHCRLIFPDRSRGLIDLPLPRLNGRHQIENAVLPSPRRASLSAMRSPSSRSKRGLTHAKWPARLERLGEGALHQYVGACTEIWLDGVAQCRRRPSHAHSLAEFEERVPRTLHLIWGWMETKERACLHRARSKA